VKTRQSPERHTVIAVIALLLATAANVWASPSASAVLAAQIVVSLGAVAATVLLGAVESLALLIGISIAVSPAVAPEFSDVLSVALYTNVGPLPFSPIELWVYLLAVKQLRVPAMRGWDAISLSLMAMFAALAVALCHGALVPEGDVSSAVRSARLLLPLFVTYALAVSAVTSGDRLMRIVNVVVMAAGFKALQGIYLKLTGTGLNYKGALRIFLGVELAALVFLLCYSLLRAAEGRNRLRWLAVSSVTVLVLVWSNARFVWVGGAAGLFAVFVTARGARLHLATLLLASAAAGILFIGADDASVLRARLSSIGAVSSEETNEIRLVETQNVWSAVLKQPLLGNGLGVEYPITEDYLLAEQSVFTERTLVHNAYLWLWFTSGILGVAAFVAAAGIGIVRALRVARRLDAHMRPAAAALAGTLVCCAVILVSGNWLLHQRAGVVIGFLLGVSVALGRFNRELRSASGYSVRQRGHSVVQPAALPA
jgi:hypothetical protein